MAAATRKTNSIGNTDSHAAMATVMDSIRSIIQTLRVSGREAGQKLGISSAQLAVLQELRERPALSINELAERTFTHQSSVSMVVSRLVERGLVTRTSSRADARRLAIFLTPAGRRLLRRLPDAAQTRLITALRSMSRADLRSLAQNLNSLTEIMAEQARPETEDSKAEDSLRA